MWHLDLSEAIYCPRKDEEACDERDKMYKQRVGLMVHLAISHGLSQIEVLQNIPPQSLIATSLTYAPRDKCPIKKCKDIIQPIDYTASRRHLTTKHGFTTEHALELLRQTPGS